MPTITVKDIPTPLYRDLKKNATRHRRSINSEVISGLESYLKSRPMDADEILMRARSLRSRAVNSRLSDEELRLAKEAGRS